MPAMREGLGMPFAIRVTGIEEVLVAKIVSAEFISANF